VRTLHHYDAIGLLRPSGRSESGYRLYNRADVARLHGIQALRHFGLSLREISSMLADKGASLPAIVARQVRVLDHEIARATELRARLDLLQAKLIRGHQPEMDDWLGTLSLMATYGKYFSAQELKKIFHNWSKVEAHWHPLLEPLRAAMARGVPHDALEIQPLVARWMQLTVQWTDGDEDMMRRLSQMYDQEPHVGSGSKDSPDQAMSRYIGRAIEARLAVLRKHFDPAQIARLGRSTVKDWDALNRAGTALLRRGASPASKSAQALVQRCMNLLDRVTNGDADFLQKIFTAHRDEPLLGAGALLDARVREFLQRAQNAGQHRGA
jgi:DNA-binding transcriptional MerR regulator